MKAKEFVIYVVFLVWCAIFFVLIGLGKNDDSYFRAASVCMLAVAFVIERMMRLHRREKKRRRKF